MELLIYLSFMATKLNILSAVIIAACIVAILIHLATNSLEYIRTYIKIIVIGVLVLLFVPTTKQVAAIYIIPQIVENEHVLDTSSKLYKVFDKYLDELLLDINNNKEVEM